MVDRLYEHILVPTDFRPGSREVFRAALALAESSNARLTLLHVLPAEPDDEYAGLDAFRLLHRAAERNPMRLTRENEPAPSLQTMENARKRLQTEFQTDRRYTIPVSYEVRWGDLVGEIVRFIRQAKVDLVAMESSRPSWMRFSSTADQLARRTPVRILKIVPPALVKV